MAIRTAWIPGPWRARGVRVVASAALALGVALAAIAAAPVPAGWREATVPHRFAFPRDHASHPDYRIEWWYYTGHLEARGRTFGYELTFFRVGVDRARTASRSAWAPHTLYLAHFAVTDERGGRFLFRERLRRPALDMAGADTARYRVWVDDWRAELSEDGRLHRLEAEDEDAAIALDLVPLRPPVLHGRAGLSAKSGAPGNASHYYSITRLDTRGRLRLGQETFDVRGTSWMDHEFGTTRLESEQAGWDWFSLQLDDGTDLMLYLLRRRDGSVDSVSAGTWMPPDRAATHLTREAFEVRATGRWKSPHSGAEYPQGWTIRLPGRGLVLDVEATVPDQELTTGSTGGVVYWEGSVRVKGTRDGKPVRGRGYAELTGYAGAPPGL